MSIFEDICTLKYLYPNDKLVLAILESKADPEGCIAVKLDDLAKWSSIKRTALKTVISDLIAHGYLHIETGPIRGQGRMYTIFRDQIQLNAEICREAAIYLSARKVQKEVAPEGGQTGSDSDCVLYPGYERGSDSDCVPQPMGATLPPVDNSEKNNNNKHLEIESVTSLEILGESIAESNPKNRKRESPSFSLSPPYISPSYSFSLKEKKIDIGYIYNQCARAREEDADNSDFRLEQVNAAEASKTETTKLGSLRGFEEWWKLWPRKVDKKATVEVWRKMRLDARATELIDDLKKRLEIGYFPEDKSKIKYPHRWLRDERFEDEIEKHTALMEVPHEQRQHKQQKRPYFNKKAFGAGSDQIIRLWRRGELHFIDLDGSIARRIIELQQIGEWPLLEDLPPVPGQTAGRVFEG